MTISEDERNELIELENQIAILIEMRSDYKNSTKDSTERRRRLVRMQMDIGKKKRRLEYLNSLI